MKSIEGQLRAESADAFVITSFHFQQKMKVKSRPSIQIFDMRWFAMNYFEWGYELRIQVPHAYPHLVSPWSASELALPKTDPEVGMLEYWDGLSRTTKAIGDAIGLNKKPLPFQN